MTDIGETLTRGTVWLALTFYVSGQVALRASRPVAARWLNISGCAAFLVHIGSAFHFYHHWSHAAAYAETARQTAELTGWKSGLGIYVNYFFAALWLATILKPSQRWPLRGFFWFMMFNGAFVFARAPMRWFGLLLCAVLIPCWWPNRQTVPKSQGSDSATASPSEIRVGRE